MISISFTVKKNYLAFSFHTFLNLKKGKKNTVSLSTL